MAELRGYLSPDAYAAPSEDLAWWTTLDTAPILTPDGANSYPVPSEAASRFAEMIEVERADPDLRDTWVNELIEASAPEIFHVGIRFPVKSAC